MNLNIKMFVLFFGMGVTFVHAQLLGEKANGINSFKMGYISGGVTVPTAIGDNFVNSGTQVKLGDHLNMMLNIYDNIYAGMRFDAFGFDVVDNTITGAYDKSTVYTVGGSLGYRVFNENNLAVGLFASLARVSYANKSNLDDFTEKGTSYAFTVDAEYTVSRYFQLFIAPEIRFDRLNIMAPSQVNDPLNSINYFAINAGIRISFWDISPDEENNEE